MNEVFGELGDFHNLPFLDYPMSDSDLEHFQQRVKDSYREKSMSEECCRRSFGASLIDSAKRVLEKPKLAPRSVRKERLENCRQCDHYLEDTDQCEICLCIMSMKASFANMRCPLDKWEEWNGG